MRRLISAIAALACCLPAMAGAVGEELVSFELCSGLDGRQGTGCGTAFGADTTTVHILVAVRVPPGTSGLVKVVWRFGDRVTQRQTLDIRAHRKSGWRTRARQRIAKSRHGSWSVEVLDSADAVLARRAFTVGPDAKPPAQPVVDAPADAPAEPAADAPAEPAADAPADPAADEPAADAPAVPAADAPAVPAADAPADPAADAPADPAAAPTGDAPTDPAVDPTGDVPADPSDAPAGDAPVDPAAAGDAPADPAAPPAAPADPEDLPEPAGEPAAGDAPPAADPPTAPAPPATAAPKTPTAPAAPASSAPPEPDPAAGDRKTLGLILLVGGVLLLITGIIVSRRRRARAAAVAVADDDDDIEEIVPADEAAATAALQQMADLVTQLWSRWVAQTAGNPQERINAAWRGRADSGRLGLEHVRLCNALEQANKAFGGLPPKGTSADILDMRLHGQAATLLCVVCGMMREVEQLGLEGIGLNAAAKHWGGREGLEEALLALLDAGAEALGTTRLDLVPYATKATTAKRSYDIELKPFVLSAETIETLGAGNRIVRVDSPPFANGPTPIVRGHTAG